MDICQTSSFHAFLTKSRVPVSGYAKNCLFVACPCLEADHIEFQTRRTGRAYDGSTCSIPFRDHWMFSLKLRRKRQNSCFDDLRRLSCRRPMKGGIGGVADLMRSVIVKCPKRSFLYGSSNVLRRKRVSSSLVQPSLRLAKLPGPGPTIRDLVRSVNPIEWRIV
jgi:hypothetical protein